MAKARSVIVAVTLLVAAGCAGRNVQTATFATFDEAKAAGAVEKGWVPALLPAHAYELRAAYAVNGHQRWGLFNFRPEQGDTLRAVLEADETPLAGTTLDVPGRIEWWPVILRGDIDAERAMATGMRAYKAKSAPLVFAVNWKQGRAYYWTRD